MSYLPILPQTKEKTDYNDGELSGVMPAVVMVGLVRAGSDQTVSEQVTLIATGAGQISWGLSWDQVCWLQIDQKSYYQVKEVRWLACLATSSWEIHPPSRCLPH
ncbi:MAG TPA: hypothetical protein VN207_00805 [Ktedonobacteraceae bacterium]|nr:hypothetical protein [Ktedonobacteraceae bacterium]